MSLASLPCHIFVAASPCEKWGHIMRFYFASLLFFFVAFTSCRTRMVDETALSKSETASSAVESQQGSTSKTESNPPDAFAITGPTSTGPGVFRLAAEDRDGLGGLRTGPIQNAPATVWRAAGSPFTGVLREFGSYPGSGWNGRGTRSNPYRLEFDGAGDWVQGNGQANPRSVAVWFRIDGGADRGDQQIFASNQHMHLVYRTGYVTAAMYGKTVHMPASPGAWHQVVLNHYQGKGQFWIDGNLVLETPFPEWTETRSPEIRMGRDVHGYRFLKGAIAEFQTRLAGMSSAEICSLYNSSILSTNLNQCNKPTRTPQPAVSLRASDLNGDKVTNVGSIDSLVRGTWYSSIGNGIGALKDFAHDSTSGWAGDGSTASPYRLEFNPRLENSVVVVGPKKIKTFATCFRVNSGANSCQVIFKGLGPYGLQYRNGMFEANFFKEVTIPATFGDWHHLVMTVKDGQLSYYHDGCLIATFPDVTCELDVENLRVSLGIHGQYGNISRLPLDGAISEFSMDEKGFDQEAVYDSLSRCPTAPVPPQCRHPSPVPTGLPTTSPTVLPSVTATATKTAVATATKTATATATKTATATATRTATATATKTATALATATKTATATATRTATATATALPPPPLPTPRQPTPTPTASARQTCLVLVEKSVFGNFTNNVAVFIPEISIPISGGLFNTGGGPDFSKLPPPVCGGLSLKTCKYQGNSYRVKTGDFYGSADCNAIVYQIGASPLMLKLGVGPIKLTAPDAAVSFDIYGLGVPSKISWPTNPSLTPFLALPDAVTGKVLSVNHLFGNNSIGPDGRGAQNGFEALRKYDSNGDGVIDMEDPIFERLRLWRDVNGDGKSVAGELEPLSTSVVRSIDLHFEERADRLDFYGNFSRQRGSVKLRSGETKFMEDVWFVVY